MTAPEPPLLITSIAEIVVSPRQLGALRTAKARSHGVGTKDLCSEGANLIDRDVLELDPFLLDQQTKLRELPQL